jgi:hypothetical protein
MRWRFRLNAGRRAWFRSTNFASSASTLLHVRLNHRAHSGLGQLLRLVHGAAARAKSTDEPVKRRLGARFQFAGYPCPYSGRWPPRGAGSSQGKSRYGASDGPWATVERATPSWRFLFQAFEERQARQPAPL